MGTRADFYVGRGEKAEWLGSIAWDGYPDGIPADLFTIADQDAWRTAVKSLLESRDDGTLPADGWPWPWEDSATTDFAYAIDEGQIWLSNFGSAWITPREYIDTPGSDEDEEAANAFIERWEAMPKPEFPNMKEKQNVTFGKRSGVMTFGA